MKIIVACFVLLCTFGAIAQAPSQMSYQAVIRNSSGGLQSNSTIGIRISILQGAINGTPVYVETNNSITNQNGLLSLVIGNGTVVSGSFSGIDWSNGPYFIQTETDINGGVNYSISSTNQLLSVPYALYAETSGSSTPGPQGPIGMAGLNGANGLNGSNGTDGLSAYQIWINQGNSGTEVDFLTSLQGAAGVQGPIGVTGAAGLQGPVGATGAAGSNGSNGANGLSAYQIWVNQGNSGTEVDFLASLQGAAGAQGPIGMTGSNGANGLNGANGSNGTNGLSAYQIWINQGNSGTETDFLNWLQAPAGADDQNLTEVLAEGNYGNMVQIKQIADPTDLQDAVTKAYVDLLEDRLDSLINALTPTPLYVQQRLDLGETPMEIYTSDNALLDSLFGKTYQGGLIASFNITTGTGLIAAPTDQSGACVWGCNGVSMTGAYGTAIGTGTANTAYIVANCASTPIAAQVANDLVLNGYSDWHLPSKDELNELYLHMAYLAISGGTQTYWCSTEFNSINGWRHNFNTNFVGGYAKTNAARVRAVRYY
ncbi:MAG: DUF1566 domain-containing protein [Bacteroidota bacterium]